MSPPVSDARTTEERLAALEQLIGGIILRAREHPVGRKILAILGLE